MSKKINIPKIVNEHPQAAVLLSKLNNTKKGKNIGESYSSMPAISDSIKEKLKNNEDIAQLFPDVELSMQILVSSILAPNDMLTTNLIYQKPDIKMPSEINAVIMETIKTYIKTNYDLTSKLGTIVREALFTKGAYIETIIPEASLDAIINPTEKESNGEVSVEDYIDTIIANNEKAVYVKDSDVTVSLEDYNNIELTGSSEDLLVDITDDLTILKAKEKLFVSIEEKKDETSDILDKLFKKNDDYEETPFVRVNTLEDNLRDSIGKPLVMKLPTEAVIPVYVTGDPTKHVGYFILLDEKGTPVTMDTKAPAIADEIDNMAKSKDNKLNIIKKAKDALNGITRKDPTLKDMEDIYGAVLNEKINKALAAGKYGDLVDINATGDIYRVMLYRALRAQKTRLLYISSENMIYYAFDYRDNGTGKSLLEKVSVLFSIRAILLFARLMANIKNSVTTTEVTATLSENDIDPAKTMEHIISEAMKTRQTQLPLGVTKIDDLVDWAHKVGFKFNFKGPGIPDMDISVSDEGTNKIVPDTDLDETIEEHIIMSFGLTPEIVKSGYDPEFATTVLANNILLAKRVMQLQDKLVPFITSHVTKMLHNDSVIRSKLAKIIESNSSSIERYIIKGVDPDNKELLKELKKKDVLITYVTNQYIKNITVTLPRPSIQENEDMKAAFEKFVDPLDDYLDLIISEDALPEEFAGELSTKLDDVKKIIKTMLVKKWAADNGYMSEINEFLTLNEDGKPELDLLSEYNEYIKALSNAIIPFLKDNNKIVDKTDDKIEKIDEEDENNNVGDAEEPTEDDNVDNMEEDNGGGDVDNNEDDGEEETDNTEDDFKV